MKRRLTRKINLDLYQRRTRARNKFRTRDRGKKTTVSTKNSRLHKVYISIRNAVINVERSPFVRVFMGFLFLITFIQLSVDLYDRRDERGFRAEEREIRKEERIARSWALLLDPYNSNTIKVHALEDLFKAGVSFRGIDLSCKTLRGGWDEKTLTCERPLDLTGLNVDSPFSSFGSLSNDLPVEPMHGYLNGERFLDVRQYSQSAPIWTNDCLASDDDGSFASLLDKKRREIRAGGIDFRNALLSGIDFSNARMSGADFTGADLRGSVFRGAVIEAGVFTDTRLDQVSFEDTLLSGSTFLFNSSKFGHRDRSWRVVDVEKGTLVLFENVIADGMSITGSPASYSPIMKFDHSFLRSAAIAIDFYAPETLRCFIESDDEEMQVGRVYTYRDSASGQRTQLVSAAVKSPYVNELCREYSGGDAHFEYSSLACSVFHDDNNVMLWNSNLTSAKFPNRYRLDDVAQEKLKWTKEELGADQAHFAIDAGPFLTSPQKWFEPPQLENIDRSRPWAWPNGVIGNVSGELIRMCEGNSPEELAWQPRRAPRECADNAFIEFDKPEPYSKLLSDPSYEVFFEGIE